MLNEWKGMENIISSTFTECWEQSACFAMIRCLTGPQIVQVSSYKTGSIHPSFTEQMIIRLLLKELLFLFGRQWRGLHFHFHEKPVLVLLISGPFFFSPISFAHHTDKSEWMRLQFFLFWVSHVQHVHTDERSNLRSIFLLAASNSLNWVWPARKSFANTSF